MTDKKNIWQSLVAVCGAVENVKRDTQGQVGNSKYKYATIDAVLEVVQPLLKAHGLALVQYVEDDSMVAILYHESGDSLPMGKYNLGTFIDSQKRGSAITYARRYQLCSIFGIAQEDDDGAEASKPARQEPTKQAKSAVFKTKTDREKYEMRVVELMEACPDVGELKAVWEDEYIAKLNELRQSDNEDDQQSYAHLLGMKDVVKAAILAVAKHD